MYITYESVASNDPRVVPEIKFIGTFWHYTISYIDPVDESEVFIKWLKPTVLSQDVAKSYKFVGATDGEISLRTAVDLNGDGIIDAIETASAQGTKIPYFLTEDDEKNTCDLMKSVMKNYIDKNSTDTAVTTRLYEIIDAASNLTETQMVMATYFDFDVASTAGKEKIKEVEVPWSTV
jgi:hypothetical protein